jgi:hypothetical protein
MLDWQKEVRVQWKKKSDEPPDSQEEQPPVDPLVEEADLEDVEDVIADNEEDEGVRTGSVIEWYDAQTPAGWVTDLDRWVCSCPSYLLSRFLICKHLIGMVNIRTNFAPIWGRNQHTFLVKLRRFHSCPFYRIESVHQIIADPGRTLAGGPGFDAGDGFNGGDEMIHPTLQNPRPQQTRFTRRAAAVEDEDDQRVRHSASRKLPLWHLN